MASQNSLSLLSDKPFFFMMIKFSLMLSKIVPINEQRLIFAQIFNYQCYRSATSSHAMISHVSFGNIIVTIWLKPKKSADNIFAKVCNCDVHDNLP